MFRLRHFSTIGILALGLAAGGAAMSFADSNRPSIPPAIQLDGEDHPEIHKALNNLNRAQEALTNAAHDYDGHRAAALKCVNDAIAQCQICLTMDK
jgi:hypothetical protein